MKILQINKYHYIRGGSDSVYFNSGKLLEEKGHQVVYFAMNFDQNQSCPEEKYFAENKDFTTLPFKKKIANLPSFFYNKNAEKNLLKLIEAEQPDIAHLHIFYGSLTSSILKILKEKKIPVVVSVHDYKFICPSYLFMDGQNRICESCEGKNYVQAVKRKCVKGSRVFSTMFALEAYFRDYLFPLDKMFSQIVFVSKFSANIHFKYKPEIKENSTHLYNFDPSLQEKKPNKEKGNYFLYAGRLSKEKGLNTLIKAFADLPHMELKIAGTGDELENLQSKASPNVTFLGFQKGEELRTIIANASFVIVPSEWYENNPMAIIEAYSLGKPVIAAAIGGIPEIVEDNLTGYLYTSGSVNELQQKIKEAHSLSDINYLQLSERAIQFAYSNFHPESHYKQLVKIYQDALLK